MAEEEEKVVRVRLVFDDESVLSKWQKKEGLNRSWVLLEPKNHRTVADFSAHLLRIFDLHVSCPHGILLSMDGFVLPPFISTCIVKDRDIISVKNKGGSLLEIVKANDEGNALEEIETLERPLLLPGVKLLANEEFQKETGGYDSESEYDEPEQTEDALCAELTPQKKVSSKKRKASSRSQNSKRKKSKLATAEESSKEARKKRRSCDHGQDAKKSLVKKGRSSDAHEEPEKSCLAKVDERNNKISNATPNSTRSSPQENGKSGGDVLSGEIKKLPSRSARRKKAKRQWLREKARMEKEELQQKQLSVNDNQQLFGDVDNNVDEEHENAVKDNHNVVEEHQAPDELNEDDVGDEAEVVPVEVTPGHFRFEPLGKVGADQPVQKSEMPMETFQWNGITSKKKGQKWGKEKTASSKRYDQSFDQDFSQMQTAEVETSANGHLDFGKLMPYLGPPKEGDVIAYRLIELSSSWTPEISSFRIGKVSWYISESKKVKLVPVPEYPIEKKMDEGDSSLQPETSLYKEDGSLEIDYSSLLDIRSVNNGSSSIARPTIIEAHEASKGVHEPNQNATSSRPSNNVEVHAHGKVNGPVNVWEEISQALDAKKAELTQESGWSKKENPGKRSWSYRALRGSALGPTMEYLRSNQEL